MAKSHLELLLPLEAEQMIAAYMAKAESFIFGVAPDGTPIFTLKNRNAIVVNGDGSVTWTARETGLGLHSFIELTTGEQRKKTIIIPLCLVNSKIRRCLKPLLDSTVDAPDGKLNSKPAECYIMRSDGFGFKVTVKLENLAIQYIMLQLFPPDFALRFKSEHCPFCRELGEVS